MNDKDKKLIEQSFQTREWSDVADLEKKAESEEAKRELKDRRMHLYHCEEYSCGLL